MYEYTVLLHIVHNYLNQMQIGQFFLFGYTLYSMPNILFRFFSSMYSIWKKRFFI
jgi:hypothetical protein